MKAIILAAGMGTRLGKYTHEKPKGMVEFLGKPLIEHQLDRLKEAGIDNIVIVRGYQADKISFPGVRYYENHDFATTNMIESLMCAASELTGEVLILYADIIYEPRILRSLVDFSGKFGIAVDTDFRPYWTARTGGDDVDNESLCLDERGIVTELGVPDPAPEKMDGRYMGMIRFSAEGCQTMLEIYHQLREKHFESTDRWRNSRSFRLGYMTDLLQEFIDRGNPVEAIVVQRGWLEIDTAEDLEQYVAWQKQGVLERFFAVPG